MFAVLASILFLMGIVSAVLPVMCTKNSQKRGRVLYEWILSAAGLLLAAVPAVRYLALAMGGEEYGVWAADRFFSLWRVQGEIALGAVALCLISTLLSPEQPFFRVVRRMILPAAAAAVLLLTALFAFVSVNDGEAAVDLALRVSGCGCALLLHVSVAAEPLLCRKK